MRRLTRTARRHPGLTMATVCAVVLIGAALTAAYTGGVIVRLIVLFVGLLFGTDVGLLVEAWVDAWREDARFERIDLDAGPARVDEPLRHWQAGDELPPPWPLPHDAEEPATFWPDDAA